MTFCGTCFLGYKKLVHYCFFSVNRLLDQVESAVDKNGRSAACQDNDADAEESDLEDLSEIKASFGVRTVIIADPAYSLVNFAF